MTSKEIADLQRAYNSYLAGVAAAPSESGYRSETDIVLHRAEVRKIENGYIVIISIDPSRVPSRFYIKDLDELGGVLVAAIVANRIEK